MSDFDVLLRRFDELAAKVDHLAETLAEHGRPAPADAWMTTPEAAKFLRCSAQTLELARLKGGGPPFTKHGRLVRYSVAALNRYLAEREQRSTSDTPRRGRPRGTGAKR